MSHLPPAIPRLARAVSPNIAFLPTLEQHRLHTFNTRALQPHKKTSSGIEVGHTCDRRLPTVVSTKLSQHRVWLDYLTSQGWTVTLYPVVITHSGLISTRSKALTACGVSPSAIATTLRKTAHHALSYNLKFCTGRHSLDAALHAQPPDLH